MKARNTRNVPTPDLLKLIAAMDSGDSVKNVDFASREKFKRIQLKSFVATASIRHGLKPFVSRMLYIEHNLEYT